MMHWLLFLLRWAHMAETGKCDVWQLLQKRAVRLRSLVVVATAAAAAVTVAATGA